MRPLHIPVLAGTWLAVAGASWALLTFAESRSKYLPTVPWVVDLVLVVLIGLVGISGWRVRAYLKGRRPGLNPLVAARTLSLAQAAALGGVLLSGWYFAQFLVAAADWGFESRRTTATAAVVAAVLALALSAMGIIVERWCRLTGGSDEDPPGGQQVEQ